MKFNNRLTTFVDGDTLTKFEKEQTNTGHNESSLLRFIVDQYFKIGICDHEYKGNKCTKCGATK